MKTMKIESNINNRISELLKQSPHPIGIDEIIRGSGSTMSRATARRRLDELLAEKQVVRQGKARATRYVWAWSGQAPLRPFLEHHEQRLVLRESSPDEEDNQEEEERERIRKLIRRPLAERTPVRYNREFLDSYEPNRTYYLPEPLRNKLRETGQSSAMARMPAATYVRSVYNRLLIDLSWNSSRLEGNTYSLLETEQLLLVGQETDPARILEARMILNHKEAIEFLVEAPDDIGFNRYTILNLHAMLSHGLLNNPRSEGRLRHVEVGIGGSVYRPLEIPQQVEESFLQILEKISLIQDPLEQSFFAMVHLPYLQPFEDVNKRVSRLAANIPLIRENLSPLSFAGVPVRDYVDATLAVYELNRVELLREVYARAYEESAARYAAVQRTLGTPDALSVRYQEALRAAIRAVVQGLMSKTTAAQHIRDWARDIPIADRSRVIEIVETELMCLHDGNFARYRLRPSEFSAWQVEWKR